MGKVTCATMSLKKYMRTLKTGSFSPLYHCNDMFAISTLKTRHTATTI